MQQFLKVKAESMRIHPKRLYDLRTIFLFGIMLWVWFLPIEILSEKESLANPSLQKHVVLSQHTQEFKTSMGSFNKEALRLPPREQAQRLVHVASQMAHNALTYGPSVSGWDEYDWRRLLSALAELQVRVGEEEGALRTIALFPKTDPNSKPKDPAVLGKIARNLAEQNHIGKAKEWAERIAPSNFRSQVLADVIRLSLQHGKVVQAIDMSHSLSHLPHKVSALTRIAHAQFQRGDREKARGTIQEALQAAKAEDSWKKYLGFLRIASVQDDIGAHEESADTKKLAAMFSPKKERWAARALSRRAFIAVRNGDATYSQTLLALAFQDLDTLSRTSLWHLSAAVQDIGETYRLLDQENTAKQVLTHWLPAMTSLSDSLLTAEIFLQFTEKFLRLDNAMNESFEALGHAINTANALIPDHLPKGMSSIIPGWDESAEVLKRDLPDLPARYWNKGNNPYARDIEGHLLGYEFLDVMRQISERGQAREAFVIAQRIRHLPWKLESLVGIMEGIDQTQSNAENSQLIGQLANEVKTSMGDPGIEASQVEILKNQYLPRIHAETNAIGQLFETAMANRDAPQYRDDFWSALTKGFIKKKDFPRALAASDMVMNPRSDQGQVLQYHICPRNPFKY